jgi:hypothetical protein
LRVVFPSGIGLAEGEAVGVEVGHVACIGVGMQLPVAFTCLMLGYRAPRFSPTLRTKRPSRFSIC